MGNDLAVQHENALQLADAMLEETQSATPRLLCKKGTWSLAGEEIPEGKEFIAYPGDALRGFCLWQDDRVVEQRVGRIADRFNLKREDLPADEDWKPQYALPLEDPETGDVVLFVSCSTGGKIAVEKLMRLTATAVKRGKGSLTPLVRLSKSAFNSDQYGTIIRPAFEIVPSETVEKELDDKIPF
jgi:hypothetical protein